MHEFSCLVAMNILQDDMPDSGQGRGWSRDSLVTHDEITEFNGLHYDNGGLRVLDDILRRKQCDERPFNQLFQEYLTL